MGLSQHLDLVNIFMKSLESSALYAKERVQLLENCRSRVDDLRALATQLEATQKTCGEDVLEQEKLVSEHIITIGRMTAEIEAHINVTKKSESDVTERQQDLSRSSAALNEVRLKVEPPFKVASSELKLMDKVLLGEVKSYNTPPLAVERVMTVAIKLSTEPSKGGTWDCSWPRAKRTIGNADRFIMDLLAVDPRTIDANCIENVRPYLVENSADVSGIADTSEPLSLVWDWAMCLLEYVDAYHDKILPLEESISKNTQLLNEAKKNLLMNKREKDQLEFKLGKVTQQFEQASTKKSSLQTHIKDIIAKIDNVRILIGLLENDEPLWKREHDDLMQKRQNTLGDALISAALIAFCGPLSQSYRSALLSSCKTRLNQLHIPLSLSCQPVDLFLHPDDEYRAYDEGLPILKYGSRNTHVLENCVISSNSLRCSLFMDPDSIALSWCRALSCCKEDDRQLRLVERGEAFVERLKVCVNAGVTVLCTITPQQSDPILHGLLQMRVIKKGKQRYIEIGPDQVELGAGFKLLLRCSCVTQPLPIAVTSKSAIINFSMSDEDLEDCLLAMVVAAHEQQVERERQNLLDDLVKNSLQVARHNNEVIDKMRNMTGNLMSFEEVERMKIFKITVDEGREKLKSTEARMGEIQRVAASYLHFARLLFVACHFTRNLWQMNMVYYFSLHEMLMVLDAGVLRCVAEKHHKAAEVGMAKDTNVEQKILENKLTCFLAEFEPEQVESAAKIAAMFADDHISLQEMLRDMYAVRLEHLSRKEWEAGFDMFDMDGDGFITRAEFESLERASIDAFTALDVDGDGRITREEYNAGFDILTPAEQEILLQPSQRESDDATNQPGQASPLKVKVHKIDGFSDTSGFLDRTDPYVSLQFGSEKQKTSYKSDVRPCEKVFAFCEVCSSR
jgi:dynein heavy chain